MGAMGVSDGRLSEGRREGTMMGRSDSRFSGLSIGGWSLRQ